MDEPRDTHTNDTAGEEERFFRAADAVGFGDDHDPMGIEEQVAERARGRVRRALMFLALVLVLGVVLLVWLAGDLAYFVSSTEPLDLGPAEELEAGRLEHDRFVRVEGIARDMCIRAEVFSGKVRFLYLLGSETGGRILIEAGAPGDADCLGAVAGSFEGRLLDLTRTDRYDNVLRYYREHFPAAPRKGPVFLLRQGEQPWSAWWVPAVVLLVVLLWALNALSLWRLLRRRRETGAEGGTP